MPKPCPKCHKPNSDNAIQCWNCLYKFSTVPTQTLSTEKSVSSTSSSEAKPPLLQIIGLVIGGILAALTELFIRTPFFEIPIFWIYFFPALATGFYFIFSWLIAKDPQNKSFWETSRLISLIIVGIIVLFLITTQTTYAEQGMKILKKGTRSISDLMKGIKKQISFYSCTLSNPINPQECEPEEENVAKDEALYDTLELTYGIKTAARVIPIDKPEGGKPYRLDFTLSNTNTPSKEFDYSINVTEINVTATDKIGFGAITSIGTVSDFPQTLAPQEYYSFEAVFSSLPVCYTYDAETLNGKIYFYVDVTTEQAVGSSTSFMLVRDRREFIDEVEDFLNNFVIRPGPGPIDVYAVTQPIVVEPDKNVINIKIKIENTKAKGIATIDSLTLIHTVESGETNPFTTITCPSSGVDPYISSVQSLDCRGLFKKDGNCMEITFNQLQIEEDSVYGITCSASINNGLNLDSVKTDDIAVEARYRYKQIFDPKSAVATCTLQTTGTTITGGPISTFSGTYTCKGIAGTGCELSDFCASGYIPGDCPATGPAGSCSNPGTFNCIPIDVKPVIASEAKSKGVPANLALAIGDRESGLEHYDANGNVKRGSSGEVGLFQVIPGTGGCSEAELMDINRNIQCGVSIIKDKCNAFGFDCSTSSQGHTYTCTGKTYFGWDIATRGYNGWEPCLPVKLNYVEEVNALKSKYVGYN